MCKAGVTKHLLVLYEDQKAQVGARRENQLCRRNSETGKFGCRGAGGASRRCGYREVKDKWTRAARRDDRGRWSEKTNGKTKKEKMHNEAGSKEGKTKSMDALRTLTITRRRE